MSRRCPRHHLTPQQQLLSKQTSRWRRAAWCPPPCPPPEPPLSSTQQRWFQTTPTWFSRWGKRRRYRGDILHTSLKRARTVVLIPQSRRLRIVRQYQPPPSPHRLRLTTHPLPLCLRAKILGCLSHRTTRPLQHPLTCLHPHHRPTRLATRRHPCLRGRATRRRRRS